MFRFVRNNKALLIALLAPAVLCLAPIPVPAQGNMVMGEVRFEGASNADKDSGVWVDQQYVGYLKELKGNKKILLLPGTHEIAVRQVGFKDFTERIRVEPGSVESVRVSLQKDVAATYPGADAATLKLDVVPNRAAVFVDDGYVGHASDFGGSFHTMLVAPGKHRVKVELPGYQTFETEISLLPGQRSQVKTELVKGSIEQAGALIRP